MAAAGQHAELVVIVVGASRGIGKSIALALARAGHKVVIAAKTLGPTSQSSPAATAESAANTAPAASTAPAPLPGSLHELAQQITRAGGIAYPQQCDVRDAESVAALVHTALRIYGRVDALVYNAGAVWWAPVADTPLARYELMHAINARGLYACVQALLPHFKQRGSGRLLAMCPPIYSRFFKGKAPYAMTKVAASVLVKGLAVELSGTDVAITGLWPATGVQSAVTDKMASDRTLLRTPNIMADACLAILHDDASAVNGQLLIDEDYLRTRHGVDDFSSYQAVPGAAPPRMMPREFPSLVVAEEAAAPVMQPRSGSNSSSTSRALSKL